MKRVSTNLDVRVANAEKVYSVLRRFGDLTKSELVGHVQLSFASVSNMCSDLEKVGLISVTENVRSTGGRKAARVSFCPDFAYTLVIDMHHTQHVFMGFVNLRNEIRDCTRFEVSDDDSLETILSNIKTSFDLLQKGNAGNILGVCVGVSAAYDPVTGRLLQSSNPVFEGVQLKRHISELFPEKMVIIDNDANLAGLSQMMEGTVVGKNLLSIFFTQGIGLGIVIDGKLYRGTNGFAGELGHIKVSGLMKPCKCGGTGCLRTVATLESIAQDLGEMKQLHDLVTSAEYASYLALRYAAGEERVIQRINLSAQKIGEVMAELFDLFNPQEIMLGGNMSPLFPYMKLLVTKRCKELSNLARAVDLQIRYVEGTTSELVLIGGGERMFQHWMETSFLNLAMIMEK
ncbi:ROK family protein [uncultured Sphaerochaeta sp.]|uniref:ROK family protein n=1 Tax=uncultured Sphaerochaeta sp. TaxID=886478 RepID=UPI002A0A0E77|nr:ROK family protein [uncultured Sphaerochaeta sp.]